MTNSAVHTRPDIGKAFRAAVMGVGVLATAFNITFFAGANPLFPSAPLTTGESRMLHGIFGDEINTSKITKHYRQTPKMIYGKVYGNRIYLYGAENHYEDLSDPTEPDAREKLVHEATHVLQGQIHSVTKNIKFRCKQYHYALKPESRFDDDFCNEQQAAIMEDYTARFLNVPARDAKWQDTTPENDALLQKVVETRFPQVRKTRLALTYSP